MKWIKYKYLCNTINIGTKEEPKYQDILHDKKIGYSEANLLIAEAEAYNGEYTIEDDGKEVSNVTNFIDNVNMNGFRITNLGDPVSDNDAVALKHINEVKDIITKMPYTKGEAVEVTDFTIEEKCFYYSSGSRQSNSRYSTYRFYNIKPNKKYIVSGSGSANIVNSAGLFKNPLVAFYNANGERIGFRVGAESENLVYVENCEVITPDETAAMLVTHYNDHGEVKVLEVNERFEVQWEELPEEAKALMLGNESDIEKISQILPLVKDENQGTFVPVGEVKDSAAIDFTGEFIANENAKCVCVSIDTAFEDPSFAKYNTKKVYITGACSQTCPLYVFVDANGKIVDDGYGNLGMGWGPDASGVVNEELTEVAQEIVAIVPDNAAFLYVNALAGQIPNEYFVNVVKVYKEKLEVDYDNLSEEVKDLISKEGTGSGINTDYIWYANIDAVVKTSNPTKKLGGIEDYKIANTIYTVLAGINVVESSNLVAMDLTAKTVDASVSVGSYSKFHNGDLLLYAGKYLTQDVWRWFPQAEAKNDRDGHMSAGDKVLVGKIPSIEALVNNSRMPVYNRATEVNSDWISGYLVNWCRTSGWYLGGIAEDCGGHPPVVNNNNTSWALLVLNGAYSEGFAPHRLQVAFDISNNLIYLRKGWQSGDNWGDWVQVGGASGTESSDVLIVTDDDIESSVAIANVTTDIKEVVVQSSVQTNIYLPESAYNYWRCVINLTDVSVNCYYNGGGNDGNLTAGKTYLFVMENGMGNVYEIDNIYRTPITEG